MGETTDRRGWWWPLGLAAGLTAALLSTIGSASAASLGGATATGQAAFAPSASTGAPTVRAHENFTGSNGSAISGTSTDSGGFTWSAPAGTWTVQSNHADSNSVDSAMLLFNGGVSNGSAEAVISRNGNTGWDTAVVVNANSTGSDCLLANWWAGTGGSISLYKRESNSYTQLANVSNLYPSIVPASATVRIESPSSSIIKVYLDGVLKLTYTLTAGEQTTFKNGTHTYAGVEGYFDGTATFDNFHLDV